MTRSKRVEDARHCRLTLLVLAGCLAVGGQASGQKQGLTLTVNLGTTSIVVGEPLYLAAELENTGPESVEVFPSLYPEDGGLQVWVAPTEGQGETFVPYSLDLTNLSAETLAQGDSITAVFPIFFGGRGWTFSTAGQYRVSAVLVNPANGARLLESEPVSLSVVDDPAGRYLQAEGKASVEAGRFLLWRSGDHLRAGIAHLRSLIEEYPDSVLANHARLALARSLSEPFRDYTIGKLRQPDPEAARQLLEAVDAERLPPYLQLERILSQLRVHRLLGEESETEAVLEQANELVMRSRPLQAVLEQVEAQE